MKNYLLKCWFLKKIQLKWRLEKWWWKTVNLFSSTFWFQSSLEKWQKQSKYRFFFSYTGKEHVCFSFPKQKNKLPTSEKDTDLFLTMSLNLFPRFLPNWCYYWPGFSIIVGATFQNILTCTTVMKNAKQNFSLILAIELAGACQDPVLAF